MSWEDQSQPSEGTRLRSHGGLTWNDIQGSWHTYKGKLRQRWGELTVKDVDDLANARKEELSGKLQRVYNMSKEQADREVEDWIAHESASRESMGDEGSHPTTTV